MNNIGGVGLLIHRFFLGLSRITAILGGIVLFVLILMVCVSIVGRSLNGILHGPLFDGALSGLAKWLLDLGVGPVNGDYELLEAGIAFSIFAFLPLAQISAAHASVDIFTSFLGNKSNRLLTAAWDIVFAVALVLIALQLKEGMGSKMRSGQTTFLLQFPIWWAYALSLSAATIAAVVGVYMACLRVVELYTGRIIGATPGGADH